MPSLRERKRPQETSQADSESTFLSELGGPDDEADSDYEEAQRFRTRVKRPPKGDGGARKQRRGKEMPRQPAAEGEGSLFEIVKSGKTALTVVVDDWIEQYKQDRDSALLDLIQFFIHCSGCKGRITPHMYHNMEHAEIIRKMTEEFEEETGDYPLIMSGPQWKKFRGNFCELIMVLVRQCQYSIIYDQYMMDNVISLLTGLTDSQVRAFRHTSTLASMKLMSALVEVALNLSINLDHTQRQYEAERARGRGKQSERLDLLMTKRQEIEENQEEIRNMLTYIFKGVFVHRYRDTQPEIRAICMAEIGNWMKRYPGMFLDDSYLKYVGWTLYDRVGDVRLCCLKCLHPLYDTDELAPKLELFTNRFKDRIVEMTLDKEYDVAVHGVRLVSNILKFSDNVLSDKDCENVYELVYSSHRAVAQAAGEFLNSKLFSRELDEATKNLKSKKGKKRSENTPLLRDLVQFFIESELHEHGAYLVDSLWEINDMLKDWECITDLLLEEPGRGEEAMDDRQETSLIEIMVCCVKQAATGEYPVGRGPNRKLTSKEVKQVHEDKTRLTEHFIVTLPQLLAKYNVDAEKVVNLLTIPLYFDLEIYTTSRQEKHLDSLLHHIADIVDKHTDSEVLENASKVLENLCAEEHAISHKCNVAKSTLIDHLAQRYKEAFQDFFQEGDDPDEDDAYALMASLKRTYAFASCHDLNSWNLWDSLFLIMKGGQEGTGIPDEIVCKAISCCHMSIMWYLDAIDDHAPDKEAMDDLRKKLVNFMRLCHALLLLQQDRIQQEAFITICDLLIVFSRNLAQNPVLEPLVYEPDKNLQSQLGDFLNEKVFIEDDDDDMDENQKIEELHKRRNFLACFCKLVVYNVISIKCAADMFKFYMKFYNDYGDIIKATLGKSREINKVVTAKTLAVSLTQLFGELKLEQDNNIDRTSEGFQAVKELARRFSLSFGLDLIKNREAVAAMHREGIIFSVSTQEDMNARVPPNIPFLEILTEFTSKLMKQDKKVVLQFLEKNTAGIEEDGSEEWSALVTYRSGLQQGDGDMTAPTRAPPSRRGRAGRRKQQQQLQQLQQLPPPAQVQEDDGQWVARSTPARAGAVGPLTSTVIRRKRTHEEMDTTDGSEIGSERDFDMSQVKRRRTPQRPPSASTRITRSKVPIVEEGDVQSVASIDAFDSPKPLRRVRSKFTPSRARTSRPGRPRLSPIRPRQRLNSELLAEEESPEIDDFVSDLFIRVFFSCEGFH